MTTPIDMLRCPVSATGALRVDGDRLWRSLMELAQIGATPKGGVRRLALTDLDGQGRDLVVGARSRSSQASRVRLVGNSLLNAIAGFLAGRRIPDLTSGFRAARRGVPFQIALGHPRQRIGAPRLKAQPLLFAQRHIHRRRRH